MDIATLTIVIGTDLVAAATAIVLVNRTLTKGARCNLVALAWVWWGTLVLVLVAIPEVVTVFLVGQDGRLLMGRDGALLTAVPDWKDFLHYLRYALPAMAAISGGMFLQGWSICKRD